LYLITFSDTDLVGFLWTRDQPVAETSTWQHTTQDRDFHVGSGIRNRSPS